MADVGDKAGSAGTAGTAGTAGKAGPVQNSPVMSLFITAGFPTLEDSLDLILGFEKNGADIIELGLPFSDPLADGPSIQVASQTAIQNGVTMPWILDLVKSVRNHSEIPVILMGYINPILHYGVERMIREAAEAGADGFIIPDLPVGEMPEIREQIQAAGMDFIHLVAPNTSSERMRLIDRHSSGFVYCVSVTGVTGTREGDEVSRSVGQFIERVQENITSNPKMIGFGIKNHEDAMRVSEHVDGFIVGSALVEIIRRSFNPSDPAWKEELFQFVRQLKFGDSAAG